MRKALRMIGFLLIIYFAFCGAMIMEAQAQGRHIDRRYPMGGVVGNNCDLIGGCDYEYRGYRRYPNPERIIGLILQEQERRRQSSEQRRYEDSYRQEEEYYRREQRRIYEEERRVEEGRSRRESGRYENPCSRSMACYKEVRITNPHRCYTEVRVNGRLIRYPDGRTLLGPLQSTWIEVPADRPYKIEFVIVR